MRHYLFFFCLSILFLDTMGSAAETQRLIAGDTELAMLEEDSRFIQRIYDKVWTHITLEIEKFSLRDFQKALYYLKEFFCYFSEKQKRSMFDAILIQLRRGDYLEVVGGIDFVPVLFSPPGEKHRCTITDLAGFLLEQEDWFWQSCGSRLLVEVLSTLNKITIGLLGYDCHTEDRSDTQYDVIFKLDDLFGWNSIWDYFLSKFPEKQAKLFVPKVKLLNFILIRTRSSRRKFWMQKKREWLKIGCEPWDLQY